MPTYTARSRRCRSRTGASTSSLPRRCSSTSTTRRSPFASCTASTAPGGRVLASTHGVMVYHPNPVDHWRWTHTGLERLFAHERRLGRRDRDARAPGTAACLGLLLAEFVHLLFKRAASSRAAARPLIAGLNAGAARRSTRASRSCASRCPARSSRTSTSTATRR